MGGRRSSKKGVRANARTGPEEEMSPLFQTGRKLPYDVVNAARRRREHPMASSNRRGKGGPGTPLPSRGKGGK